MAKLNVFHVTSAGRRRKIAVIAEDAESAIKKSEHRWRRDAKLSGSPVKGVKVGNNVAAAIHANRGVEAWYRRQIQALVTEMAASYQYWLKAAMRKNPPRMEALVDTAQDASPSDKITRRVNQLGRQWQEKFDDMASRIAAAYVSKMFKASDAAMRMSLKAAGWSVEFTMTAAVRDAYNASVAENVSLIKSIPSQYHTQVEGAVMRGYVAGRDLQAITKELRTLYPKASRRVNLIARDQSNKANAVVNRARQLELGITEAIWMHSHAGKEPRPDHLAANGKRYNIAEGCKISGEFIQPGELINCRCTSRPVLPF